VINIQASLIDGWLHSAELLQRELNQANMYAEERTWRPPT